MAQFRFPIVLYEWEQLRLEKQAWTAKKAATVINGDNCKCAEPRSESIDAVKKLALVSHLVQSNLINVPICRLNPKDPSDSNPLVSKWVTTT